MDPIAFLITCPDCQRFDAEATGSGQHCAVSISVPCLSHQALPFAFSVVCPYCGNDNIETTGANGVEHVEVVLPAICCLHPECQEQQKNLDAEQMRRYEAWRRADGCNIEWCE